MEVRFSGSDLVVARADHYLSFFVVKNGDPSKIVGIVSNHYELRGFGPLRSIG